MFAKHSSVTILKRSFCKVMLKIYTWIYMLLALNFWSNFLLWNKFTRIFQRFQQYCHNKWDVTFLVFLLKGFSISSWDNSIFEKILTSKFQNNRSFFDVLRVKSRYLVMVKSLLIFALNMFKINNKIARTLSCKVLWICSFLAYQNWSFQILQREIYWNIAKKLNAKLN